jgi:hypothetical protein
MTRDVLILKIKESINDFESQALSLKAKGKNIDAIEMLLCDLRAQLKTLKEARYNA